MSEAANAATVHLLRVTLEHVRPAVRRQLEMPSAATMGELAAVLTLAFDWAGGHLHEFEVGRTTYGPDELVDDNVWTMFGARLALREDDVTLGRVLSHPGAGAVWTYDLGDEWQHRVEVTAVVPADPDTVYPRCTAGTGLAPEEDTGHQRPGTFGEGALAELNATLANSLGLRGRDLPAETDPDAVFAGLFPGLVDTELCDCPECGGDLSDAEWHVVDAIEILRGVGELDPDDESGDDDEDDGFGEFDEDDEDDEFDDEPLPALRPLPDDELAALAAGTPLLTRAVSLARWVGDGRALTPAKVLRPAEADKIVAELGLDQPVLPLHAGADPLPFGSASGSARGSGKGRKRSAKEMPALHAVWQAALAGGLIEIRGQKAYPGPALEAWTGPADAVRRVRSWERLLVGYLAACSESEQVDVGWLAGPQRGLLPASVVMLYTAGDEPLWPGALAVGELVSESAARDEDVDPMAVLTISESSARWAGILEQWATAGIVVATDEQDADELGAGGEALERLVDELRQLTEVMRPRGRRSDADPVLESALGALRRGPFVEVTPFGRYWLARILRAHGAPIPTIGDLAGLAPGELLLALRDRDPVDVAPELLAWLEALGDGWEPAVRELGASAAVETEEGALRRSVLPSVIGVLTQAKDVGAILEQWQVHPLLAAAVAIGRFGAGHGPEPTVDHYLWVVVDTLAIELDDVEAFGAAAELLEIESLLASPGGIAAAGRLTHPQARDVLRRLALCLDDQTLAARLRRVLKGRGR